MDRREIIRKGSKSFAAAARLFDAETRDNVYRLYAWCRFCDDLIDGQELGFRRNEAVTDAPERLAWLREMTRRAVDGEPTGEPVFDGLGHVVARYQVPGRYPMELIDGFEMDVAGREYRSLEDTLLYCYHVAGVVGIMMAYVMGARDPAVLRRAADLGIAFQITNISRDVIDDAVNGRVYLPWDWLEAAGVEVGEVALEEKRGAVFGVVERLLDVADRYYVSAGEGVRALGFRAAWAISTAAGVYRDIGELVRSRRTSAWDRRAVVPKGRKILWSARGAGQALSAVSVQRLRDVPPRATDLWIKPDLC